MQERIISAAIWYKDLPTQIFLPKNVTSGIVISGYRHAHCIETMKVLAGLRTTQYGPDSVGNTEQGFITSQNRFVNRIEAMQIALDANQVKEENLNNPIIGLFSEDLY